MKTLITAALPYANGPIHFGHVAGAYLPADCYARFCRLRGDDVLFLCGSDEYGVAITMSAEMAGRSPQAHVDMFHEINKTLFSRLNVSFDHFSRTTNPFHVPFCQEFFLSLHKNGYIETKETEQLYSVEDGKFYADRYVVGTCPKCGYEAARGDECTKCGASFEAQDLKNPRAKQTGKPLVLKKTTHWFLRLDLFKEKLQNFIAQKNWKPNVVNFIKSYIDDLRPRAITRDMSWGVPVPLPEAQGKVLYVWFDAPIGYITAAQEWASLQGTPDRWKEYWLDPKARLIQFLGKDNIPFHAVIFPSMIMGQDLSLKLVDDLPANEFYNLEGKQFSKSDGWYIDLQHFLDTFDADLIRYTIASNAPESQDSEFTWKDFQLKSNSELSGKFGNFIHRTLTFALANCGGVIPQKGQLEPIDEAFLNDLSNLLQEAFDAYGSYRLRRACQIIMEMAQKANVYFDAKKPWKEESIDKKNTTIWCCLEAIKLLTLVANPVLPAATAAAFQMLTQKLPPKTWQEWREYPLVPGTEIKKPTPLFKKLEDADIEQARKTLMSTPTKTAEPTNLISIDDVRKVELRVVKIVQAERVPKSKKLLRLQVETGSDTRQILAGIGESYEPDALIGIHAVAVINLKPAKLMGLESNGMMLAGHDQNLLKLITIEGLAAGSTIS